MIDLYFGTAICIFSTILILGSFALIVFVVRNRKNYRYWGRTFAAFFVIGLLMSIISGTRDMIGSSDGFPTSGTIFIVLCGLGVLGFIVALAGLISKIAKTNVVFHYGSYILMAIIIVKTILVESNRIIALFS
ncbi:hypothetical protein IGI44_003766 [Enterococcus sp. DIV0756]